MKLSVLFVLVFVMLSCGEEPASTVTIDDYINEGTADEFEENTNELWNEDDAQDEQGAFIPFASVDRMEDGELNELLSYEYQDVFDFLYPEIPAFTEMEKEDHLTYSASVIAGGKIYAITVDDYTNFPDADIDKGFTNFIHKSKISFMEGITADSRVLQAPEYTTAIYSCYAYEMNGNTYFNDYITYGIEHYLIHLTVTSKLRYEAANKVQQFVDGFKLK